MLLKGLCAGFFYTFISMGAMRLVSHYIIDGNTRRGFLVTLGITTVQVIYSAIASLILFCAFIWLHGDPGTYAILGAIILFIMAVRIYRSRITLDEEKPLSTPLWRVFSAGFGASIIFPRRILGFGAIFAVLGVNDITPTLWESTLPVIGVCIGSFFWWLLFTITVHITKRKISPRTLQHFHRYAAMTLMVFTAIGLLQLYF